jgi:hypothetical protein
MRGQLVPFQVARLDEGDPLNRKYKKPSARRGWLRRTNARGRRRGFFTTAIAQILVLYRQLGQRYIHLTSNLDMTSVPQKEMLHHNESHCNATSLLCRFLQHKPKNKNRQITEASPAYLTLEGEGDAF